VKFETVGGEMKQGFGNNSDAGSKHGIGIFIISSQLILICLLLCDLDSSM
jgi:hypothetical protein